MAKAPTRIELAVQLTEALQRANYYENKCREEQGARQQDAKKIRAEVKESELKLIAQVVSNFGQSVQAFEMMIRGIRNGY